MLGSNAAVANPSSAARLLTGVVDGFGCCHADVTATEKSKMEIALSDNIMVSGVAILVAIRVIG